MELGETPQETLVREIKEELDGAGWALVLLPLRHWGL